MRLLKIDERGAITLTKDYKSNIPPYAILSHTWGTDDDEVDFSEMNKGPDNTKTGYRKIQFCGKQARKDGLEHFWIDTCCINKADSTELSEAVLSMYRWYREAVKCYVYLSDVKADVNNAQNKSEWEGSFWKSRWFTRGWTLQELLAPRSVEFFSLEEQLLGSKSSLEQLICEITKISPSALQGTDLAKFPDQEKFRWVEGRDTKRAEDKAYCLLGIFNVFMPLLYGERDNAWARLNEEIAKRTKTLPTAVHMHWLVTRHPNPLFTGRNEILHDLKTRIRDMLYEPQARAPQPIVITGMGGQGKSEICVQLAHSLREKFWGVFWVDITTTVSAEKAFLGIAQRLELSAQTWEAACLCIANLKQPWLLVLDNADDPEVDYSPYMPCGPFGVVILTSRIDECQQYTTHPIELSGLPEESAQALLLKAARVPVDQHESLRKTAIDVVHLLQSHPLALNQAGAYVARGHCTLNQYPHVYKRQRKRLLSFRPVQAQSRYRDVYATFEASIEILVRSKAQEANDAMQLLPILAVFAPDGFPLSLFETACRNIPAILPTLDDRETGDLSTLESSWHLSNLPSFLSVEGTTWDDFRLTQAVYLLKSLALVSTDSSEGVTKVSMHSLVHVWARDRQDVEEQHQTWIQAIYLVGLSLDDHEFWQQHERQLQPHLTSFLSMDLQRVYKVGPVIEITRVLVKCGYRMQHMRADMDVLLLTNRMFEILNLSTMVLRPEWMNLYILRGRNLQRRGHNEESIELFRQMLSFFEQNIDEAHEDRLFCQFELAQAYDANGQKEVAMGLMEHVVRIWERTVAETDDRRLRSQRMLASIYRETGRAREAMVLTEHVVKMQRQTWPEDDDFLLGSQHLLAYMYLANDRAKEATTTMEHILNIREGRLAQTHPDLLASKHMLANAYLADGRTEDAMMVAEQLEKIHQHWHDNQADRIKSLQLLARVYLANGRTAQAVELMERAVKMEEKILNGTHPTLMASRFILAETYEANEQLDEATELMEQIAKHREQTLPETDRDRLMANHNLAVYLWRQGDRERAFSLMTMVVDVAERTFDEDHQFRQVPKEWLTYFEIMKEAPDNPHDGYQLEPR